MNANLAPDLTPFVIAFVIIDVLAALVVLGVVAVPFTAFVRKHHATRVRRHQSIFSYYGHLAAGN